MSILDEITPFANQNPVCFLATVERGAPRIRTLLLWFADETGFYFYTSTVKDLYRQLRRDPQVEVCFYQQGCTFMDTRMLRVSGQVEFVGDEALMERLKEERGYLQKVGESLVLFRLTRGRALLWSGSEAFKKSRPVPFRCLWVSAPRAMSRDACLTFFSGRQYHQIKYESVTYLSSHGKQTVIHSRVGDYPVMALLKDLEGKLPEETFLRIHKQYLINRSFLVRIDPQSGGRYRVYLSDDDDTALPVGRAFARKVRMIAASGTFIP